MKQPRMRRFSGRSAVIAAAVIAGFLGFAAPTLAQDGSDREAMTERLEELPGQVEQALRGLIDSLRPTIDRTLGIVDVFERIDSPEHYQDPEILPNGDILIRRDPDAPDWRPQEEAGPDRRPGEPQVQPDEGTRT